MTRDYALVTQRPDGKLHCGGCGRRVRGGHYEACDRAPCGKCAWAWENVGDPPERMLVAVPRRAWTE